nr:uncharacterized protein LOC108071728 [Drosophila kikkawai]
MCLFIVVLILFGSFSSSLSAKKCRFDKIYNEVNRFCKKSEFPGCKTELTNLNTFLTFFFDNTKTFCNLRRIKEYCKPCSINATSNGNGTTTTGNGTTTTGNGTITTGN